MKRSVAIMLVGLLVLFSLIACSLSTTDTNPYSTLQFPSELRFGMSAEEVANTLSIEIAGDEKVLDNLYGDASYDSEYIGGYDKLPLNNNCAVCSVIYKFDNPRIEEFKDQRTLNQVIFEVRDTIPYKLRTAEKHGDILSEYEAVKDYFEVLYGEPIDSYNSELGEIVNKWNLSEESMGIVLRLMGETTSQQQGSFEVQYLYTKGLVEDWYLK